MALQVRCLLPSLTIFKFNPDWEKEGNSQNMSFDSHTPTQTHNRSVVKTILPEVTMIILHSI